jgi:hypothetical protein
MPQGKLLGFIVSHRGIEANLEKINAITAMDAPRTIKDLQKLTGYMAALNRFISRLGKRGLPFFKLLKLHNKFQARSQAPFAVATHPDGSPTKRESATLHHHDYSRCRYGNHGGMTGRRPRFRGAATSLLHQRSPL